MVECKVKLLYEEQELFVTQVGIKTAANRKKIVAKATIDAVEKILGQTFIFDVQDVISTTNRDITFISVLVNMVINESEETMVGSAIVKNDINEAIAKATLAAINRRVQKKTLTTIRLLLKATMWLMTLAFKADTLLFFKISL